MTTLWKRVTTYFKLKESRALDAKQDPRFRRLTLAQYAFWVHAFADTIGTRLVDESTTLEEKVKATDTARQTAWDKLYERWPELRG
jgi:hypothetical protein